MGYLDNTSITVDAVLTKKGREILKDGGSLNITSFTCTDTGVDYTLWNTDHPSGSTYYGEAIENLPMLEASVHAEYNMKNRLISLNQNSIAIPALVIDSGLDAKGGAKKTFNDGEEAAGTIVIRLVGFSGGTNSGIGMIIAKPDIISTTAASAGGLSGTGIHRTFLSSEDIADAQEYMIPTTTKGSDRVATFELNPLQQDSTNQKTNIFLYDYDTGAQISFEVINNITKPISKIVSTGGVGAKT